MLAKWQTDELNQFAFSAQVQILDQVTITGTSDLSDEVETSYGKKKKKSVGYSTSTITSEDISPGAVTIVDAIRGKFTNVQVAYNQDGAATGNKAQIYVRGGTLSINNSAAAIFDDISISSTMSWRIFFSQS